jgi:hypothetical protein
MGKEATYCKGNVIAQSTSGAHSTRIAANMKSKYKTQENQAYKEAGKLRFRGQERSGEAGAMLANF